MKDAFLLIGFVLVVAGTALLSIPAAMIVAGVVLMLVGVAGHFYTMRRK